jgi:gliding motility-associated-like protein
MDSDTIVVDIHGTEPIPTLGPDTTLCEGEVLTLVSNADPETTIEWIDIATGALVSMSPTTEVDAAGTYVLTETNHCGIASDTIVVTYHIAPEPFDLGEDVILCPGESIVLNAPMTTDLITWQDGSHDTTLIADHAQTYTLLISNDCGEVRDEISISFDQQEPEVDLDGDVSLCPDEVLTLDVTQGFAAEYLWSTGSMLPTLHISQPDVYAVTVSTECYSVSDDVIIEVDQECGQGLFIPNIFSPNGDNINDEWSVNFSDPLIRGIRCRIFDRWGDVVFSTEVNPIMWDGYFNESPVNPGVYVYLIEVERPDGIQEVLSGDITLVR